MDNGPEQDPCGLPGVESPSPPPGQDGSSIGRGEGTDDQQEPNVLTEVLSLLQTVTETIRQRCPNSDDILHALTEIKAALAGSFPPLRSSFGFLAFNTVCF